MQTITAISAIQSAGPIQNAESGRYQVQNSQPPASPTSPAKDVAAVKTALAEHDIHLNIQTDPDTQAIVVQLVDQRTGEAVLQIPTAVSLKLEAQFIKLNKLFVNKFD